MWHESLEASKLGIIWMHRSTKQYMNKYKRNTKTLSRRAQHYGLQPAWDSTSTWFLCLISSLNQRHIYREFLHCETQGFCQSQDTVRAFHVLLLVWVLHLCIQYNKQYFIWIHEEWLQNVQWKYFLCYKYKSKE